MSSAPSFPTFPAAPANPQHAAFIKQLCANAKAGIAALTAAGVNVQTYTLLNYADATAGITQTDLVGNYSDLAPADIAAAIAVFSTIATALAANNSAAMAALLKVAR